jgi:hypothetical protein
MKNTVSFLLAIAIFAIAPASSSAPGDDRDRTNSSTGWLWGTTNGHAHRFG